MLNNVISHHLEICNIMTWVVNEGYPSEGRVDAFLFIQSHLMRHDEGEVMSRIAVTRRNSEGTAGTT